jgi:sRNA-binding protein
MQAQLKRGDRVRVPYGAGTYDATIVDVRDGRVYVVIDLDLDSTVETFYPRADSIGA